MDTLFREAVSAIDAGDLAALDRLLAAHPGLVRERLTEPGDWLRDQVGGALEGFFADPYLLWFVAEDPVRNGRLPDNIAQVAQRIVDAARREAPGSLAQQLDEALPLVAWSGVARTCGVQIALLDVLIDAGASPLGNANNALVNGHFDAAAHLIERGDPLTLPSALCLGRWADVERLAPEADARNRQFGYILAALNGRAEAVARMLALGVDLNAPSQDLYSHATALHHAVCSGSLETVRTLVEAGADRSVPDTAFHGTALGWAEHYVGEQPGARQYAAIADYLRVGHHCSSTPPG